MSLEMALEAEQTTTRTLTEEVRCLNERLRQERERAKHVWALSCDQLRSLDEECGKYVSEYNDKCHEIELLRNRVHELERVVMRPVSRMPVSETHVSNQHEAMPIRLKGAPNPAHPPVPELVTLREPSITPSVERRISFTPNAEPVHTLTTHTQSSTTPRVGRKISFTPSTVHTPRTECTTSPDVGSTSATSTPPRACPGESSVVVGTRKSAHSGEVTKEPARRSGKAPPVDPLTGEDQEVRFEDWLPTLERAASWNRWTSEEQLIQLAGHLRGKALQEWNLMNALDKQGYRVATAELSRRMDPSSRVMAVQDFRHPIQREAETVAD